MMQRLGRVTKLPRADQSSFTVSGLARCVHPREWPRLGARSIVDHHSRNPTCCLAAYASISLLIAFPYALISLSPIYTSLLPASALSFSPVPLPSLPRPSYRRPITSGRGGISRKTMSVRQTPRQSERDIRLHEPHTPHGHPHAIPPPHAVAHPAHLNGNTPLVAPSAPAGPVTPAATSTGVVIPPSIQKLNQANEQTWLYIGTVFLFSASVLTRTNVIGSTVQVVWPSRWGIWNMPCRHMKMHCVTTPTRSRVSRRWQASPVSRKTIPRYVSDLISTFKHQPLCRRILGRVMRHLPYPAISSLFSISALSIRMPV